MAKRLQFKRLIVLALLLAVAFAGLAYRLVDLQVLRHDELKKEAQNQTKYIYRLEPKRGDILDARGELLATSVFVKTVCADPSLIGNRYAEVAHAIAPILDLKEPELAQRLMPRTRQNDKGETLPVQYVRLKTKVPSEVWDRVRDTMSRLTFAGVDEKKLPRKERDFYDALRKKAVSVEPVDDQQRTYPNQTLAAHVLGYTGTAERNVDGVLTVETVGIEGIEKTLDDKLKGIRGWRVSERDRNRREMVALREEDVEPHDGLNAVLTIDSVIQHIVENALEDGMEKNSPVSISGIVVRPRTGEILALATLPTFNPNILDNSTPENRRNRPLTDIAEPGSTFKLVVVSGALNDHTVGLQDVFNCEHGHFPFAGKILHDHAPYDNLSVKEIITKSSNIGAAKVGIRMGQDRLYEYIRDFGFGSKTGIALPGEVSGIVHPVNKWSKVSIAQIPMGQGVAVTSMQMVMAMCAVANNGVLMRPVIVDRLVDEDGTVIAKYKPQQIRRVISEEANREMIEALKTVPTPEGTAPKAALEHYTVAGKTGTAQKTDGHQYLDNQYYSSFIGFFPADKPEICIYVCLDNPRGGHYGGDVAGPIFKQIAEKAANYLNIRPDRNLDIASDANANSPTPRPVRTGLVRPPSVPRKP